MPKEQAKQWEIDLNSRATEYKKNFEPRQLYVEQMRGQSVSWSSKQIEYF